MSKLYTTEPGRPYPLGAYLENGAMCFSAVMKKKESKCGVILYHRGTGRPLRIPFSEEHRQGLIYSIRLYGFDEKEYGSYQFYEDNVIFTDPYARCTGGYGSWGSLRQERRPARGIFSQPDYDWEGDSPLQIPYEDSVIYCLHVRGFTMHASSKVKHRGTFLGLMEKIPYLKELGITAVELLPAYELDEIDVTDIRGDMDEAVKDCVTDYDSPSRETGRKLNYWGFKEGLYFAPRRAYSAGDDPEREFKEMVKALHRSGIEVIMQFYFPSSVNQGLMLDAVKYWVSVYHIDGVHLKGENIPRLLMAREPLLSDTKLLDYDFPYEEIYGQDKPDFRSLASCNDHYMNDIRRFLKGDADMLNSFLSDLTANPANHGIINYITNYYGFTLMDLVSYDRKHNEDNGEDNHDGDDYNFSWNCGVEGKTRKKSILELRKRQIKNALTILFLSQGTPLINSGDEFGNTQNGNNNPYCQDNEIGWVNWTRTALGQEILDHLKKLTALRREHRILHMPEEFRMFDYTACGYPDLSFHGEEAWRPDLDNTSRFVGAMFCGKYAQKRSGEQDDFFYAAFNMHWLPHRFALPKLPKGMRWRKLADTALPVSDFLLPGEAKECPEEQQHVEAQGRSICLYAAVNGMKMEEDAHHRRGRTAF